MEERGIDRIIQAFRKEPVHGADVKLAYPVKGAGIAEELKGCTGSTHRLPPLCGAQLCGDLLHGHGASGILEEMAGEPFWEAFVPYTAVCAYIAEDALQNLFPDTALPLLTAPAEA